jgi:hypothetical protein
MIYQVDMGVSTQMGMPRIIKDSVVDTAEPRNLFDSDFDAETQVLPESRPETQLTPVLVSIAKLRLAKVASAVLKLVTTAAPVAYSEVIHLDRRIMQVFLRLPEPCKFSSLADEVLDPPNLVCQVKIRLLCHRLSES